MKAVILAGGFGTRFSEETIVKPKPMIEIVNRPILWHIMKIYSSFGIKDFIICLGYKGYVIKEYFFNYLLHSSDLHIDLSSNSVSFDKTNTEPWKISLIDTGEDSMTGGRILRIKELVENDPYFFLTYGDGLSNVNIEDSISSHLKSGKLATVTCVKPPGRFGAVEIKNNQVTAFNEKSTDRGGLINGGFFVLSPKVFEYIQEDATSWEQHSLKHLAADGQLNPYVHNGFWQPMDTLRDKIALEEQWNSGQAKWKIW
jgi:glucose-1-phosphate cytidylyltransferase